MRYFKLIRSKAFLFLLLVALIATSGCFIVNLYITTSGLPDGYVDKPYNAWVHANQWVDQWAILGNLPPGIHFTDGNFSGTPSLESNKTYPITVEAIQYGPGGDRDYKGFSITIYNP